MTEARRDRPGTREIKGTAGYVSPYPYLDRLQEKMEERLARKVPVRGRFCGFCYGRLRPEQPACPFCAHEVASAGTVEEVPQDVLQAYRARQKTEATWVHLGAFFGLILAALVFLWQVIWAPGVISHPALAFVVLILGGYLLAQVFGPVIGAQVGYRKGSRKRDALWARHLAARDAAGPASNASRPVP
jgi:hypothetical protein